MSECILGANRRGDMSGIAVDVVKDAVKLYRIRNRCAVTF
jgi:hypothetical protein